MIGYIVDIGNGDGAQVNAAASCQRGHTYFQVAIEWMNFYLKLQGRLSSNRSDADIRSTRPRNSSLLEG